MLGESYAVAPSVEKPEEKKKINLTPYVMILLILVCLFIAFKVGRNFIHI